MGTKPHTHPTHSDAQYAKQCRLQSQCDAVTNKHQCAQLAIRCANHYVLRPGRPTSHCCSAVNTYFSIATGWSFVSTNLECKCVRTQGTQKLCWPTKLVCVLLTNASLVFPPLQSNISLKSQCLFCRQRRKITTDRDRGRAANKSEMATETQDRHRQDRGIGVKQIWRR